MAKAKLGKNTLPLLAITALLLSVALVNYDQFIVSNINSTQSVLSESDERDEDGDGSDEDEKEEELEVRNETVSRNRETEMVEKREEIERADQKTIKVEEEIEIEEEDEDEDGVETEFEEESETVSSNGSVNKFKLKIKTRTTSGKTIVETASGEVEVEKDPDDVINDLVEDGLIDDPVSFEAKVNNREKVEFEIQGTDSKRFLGIFKIVIPKLITVSSETGEIISTNQNVWSRILSLLSV